MSKVHLMNLVPPHLIFYRLSRLSRPQLPLLPLVFYLALYPFYHLIAIVPLEFLVIELSICN